MTEGLVVWSQFDNLTETGEILFFVFKRVYNNLKVLWNFGETAVGKCDNANATIAAYLGYGGEIGEKSLYWRLSDGQEGEGAAETTPPAAKETITQQQLIAYSKTTPTATIANGLRQNASVKAKDANGNSELLYGRRIFYDYENRPILIVMADGTQESYTYDHEGQRIKKQTNSGNYELYYGTLFDELYSSGGSLLKQTKYIHAGSQRVALKDSSGNAYFIHADHLGSTHLMTNAATGAVVRTNKYYPFGGTFETSGTADDTHKYTGQVLDDNTGLYYYNARYYDPVLSQFITPDTIVQDPYDPQFLNRYTYCRNNPIKLLDISGRDAIEFNDINGANIEIFGYSLGFGHSAQHLPRWVEKANYENS